MTSAFFRPAGDRIQSAFLALGRISSQTADMALRLRVPHTLALILFLIVGAWLSSFVIPAGRYERTTTPEGREMVVPGSYAPVADVPSLTPWTLLTAVPRGFAQSQDIIFFVFIIGGAIAVVRATGTIDAALSWALRHLANRQALLVGMGMVLFAAGSSTLGMAEEYLPFVAVLLALGAGLKLDAMASVGIMVIGYGVGYGVAAINPFTVVVAQQIAGLPPTSGVAYRLALFLPFLAIGYHHVVSYTRAVTAGRRRSLVDGVPDTAASAPAAPVHTFTPTHAFVLLLAFAAVAVIIWGLSFQHWYLEEMGAVFLALAVAVAVIARLSTDQAANAFATGVAELTLTALLIGFARGIKIVLEDGQIIDSIVHAAATPLATLGPYASASGMVVIQAFINLFIPSGSGQAYVTMPLMAPIADLTGVSRQIAVLAFQFGDGFTNMILPTNPVLMGILGIARIPYAKWLRFMVPLTIKFLLASWVAVIIAVAIGYD